ncbi:MAG: hypothetical protein ABFC89_02450 [Methanospirillum sp.]
MTGRPGCRARPGPVLSVEGFLAEHPGEYRPSELASAFAGVLEPSAVAEVVAYLLATGRVFLDGEGYLVRPG